MLQVLQIVPKVQIVQIVQIVAPLSSFRRFLGVLFAMQPCNTSILL